jgi:type IV pilus assembly protein PilM
VVGAVREALDGVVARGSGAGAGRDVTLVVPDAAVRVLLLDFDQLPGKAAEALPVIRFRLKKLLPFDVDDAMVSYQMMSSGKGEVRVVAVAMPKAVLDEYEGLVTAAGYLAGAVLPSTLAALAALDETDAPVLVVNAGIGGVTTAIVQAGTLLLHRSVDMARTAEPRRTTPLSLVDRESSAQEWAQQEALGSSGYDRFEAAVMRTEVLDEADVRELAVSAAGDEVAQAVSVAAAYFEDTLQISPESVLAAGPLGADVLSAMLRESGLEGLRVREMVDGGMLAAGAAIARAPRSWLAGVRGALKS